MLRLQAGKDVLVLHECLWDFVYLSGLKRNQIHLHANTLSYLILPDFIQSHGIFCTFLKTVILRHILVKVTAAINSTPM